MRNTTGRTWVNNRGGNPARIGYRIAIVGAVLGALAGITAAGSGAAADSKAFTVYATPTTVQFMNHADDRIRGMSANPFTPNEQALVIVANGTEKKGGPFPGDDVLYTFKLSSSATGGKNLGSAMFTCYYTFFKKATCEAYFVVNGNELVADGQIVFGGPHFALAVSGGTKAYTGAHGQVTGTAPSGSSKPQRLDFAVDSGGAPASSGRSLGLYSVASQVQYLNNADDEARGETNNPFDGAINKLRPKLSWKGNGPFAGDVTVYSFKLYDDAALQKSDGTATYTCYFNYDKKAFCDADFILKGSGGTITAAGPVDFNTTSFSLVVTGGTDAHLGARGELAERSLVKKNAERITMLFA
jgi:hypothetical protein